MSDNPNDPEDYMATDERAAVLISDSLAARAAADRLLAHGGSIRDAWDSLGTCWSMEQVTAYLDVARQPLGLDDDEFGRYVGGVMAFAIVAVTKDRLNGAERSRRV
jgi:hypothetical protein